MTTRRAPRPGSDVRVERTLAAAPEQVYAAWTDPAILQRWFCPNPALPLVVTVDVVVGGRYRVEMGSDYVAEGTYTELVPHRTVAFTWQWAHEEGVLSHVRVELEPADEGGTHLVLLHTGLADPDDAKGHGEGWDLSLGRLAGLELARHATDGSAAGGR